MKYYSDIQYPRPTHRYLKKFLRYLWAYQIEITLVLKYLFQGLLDPSIFQFKTNILETYFCLWASDNCLIKTLTVPNPIPTFEDGRTLQHPQSAWALAVEVHRHRTRGHHQVRVDDQSGSTSVNSLLDLEFGLSFNH